MLQHLCRKDRRIRTPRRLFFPTACLQEAGRRHVSRAHFHGICRMIMCACFLVFGDCFLVLIAFSNLVFRSLSPNAHRCVRFRASFMSTVSSLLPVSPALDEIGTLRHLLKAYKSSAYQVYFARYCFTFSNSCMVHKTCGTLRTFTSAREPLHILFRGRRQGRKPLNPARGPLAVALPKAFLSSP